MSPHQLRLNRPFLGRQLADGLLAALSHKPVVAGPHPRRFSPNFRLVLSEHTDQVPFLGLRQPAFVPLCFCPPSPFIFTAADVENG